MITAFVSTTSIWGITLVSYEILLRKESFHSFNRFYLLSMLIIGVIVPYIHILPKDTQYTMLPEWITSTGGVINVESIAPATTETYYYWILALYLIGVSYKLIGLAREILLLQRWHKDGETEKIGKWTIIRTQNTHAPFSIGNYIYLSKNNQYNDDETEMIMKHEQAHGKMLHVVDIIIMQAIGIMYWFHPFVKAIEKRLLMIHEYQADKKAAEHPKEYCMFLLEQATMPIMPTTRISFNRSPIKNRIKMLTKKSARLAQWKKLFIVPSIALSVPLLGHKGTAMPNLTGNVTQKTNEGKTESASTAYDMMQYLSTNIKYPPKAKEQKTQGKVIVVFTVTEKGEVNDVKIKRGLSEECDNEAMRVVKAMPKWNPAKKDGIAVSSEMYLPITFKL